jgi:hypothetical protein
MADKSATQVFPRRDAQGRVADFRQLMAAAFGGTVLGWVLVAVVDGILALIGIGSFGTASGWLAAILPALLFFDDFRAWREYPVRYLVGLVGLAVSLGLGLLAAGLAHTFPAIVSGAVGAVVAAGVYTLVWFFGIRWLGSNQFS